MRANRDSRISREHPDRIAVWRLTRTRHSADGGRRTGGGGRVVAGRLSIVRAAHLHDYVSVLRALGAPVDRELERSRLPGRIEETPDLYVNTAVAMEWTARAGRDLDPMELGLLAARNASLSTLRPIHQASIVMAQTGLLRLTALAGISRFEDSTLDFGIRREGENVRILCDMTGLTRHPSICFAEWLNLQAVITVVRSVAGPWWRPSEMCFVSSHRVPEAVKAAFPDTRILLRQPQTSIVVARADLARPTKHAAAAGASSSADATDAPPAAWEFASLLRMMVQPYLREGSLDVASAAEMAGISTRTLQRRLKLCGSSYSRIVQEARFALARTGLEDPALKIIDVAMMAGYESPQHFSRAFRRFTGCTPTEYRHRSAEAGA